MLRPLDHASLVQSGPDGLADLHALIARHQAAPGIAQTLGIRLVHAERGFVVYESIPLEKYYNTLGFAHGGYIATLLDTACGGATHSMLAADRTYATIELKIAYHRPVSTALGPVHAEGRIVSCGQRVAFTEAKLLDQSDRLLASATSTLLITPR